MTGKTYRTRIDELTGDDTLSREDRIAGLMQIYLDARALQRASNEGGMTGQTPPGSADEDLRHVEDALRKFGVDPLELESRDASSL